MQMIGNNMNIFLLSYERNPYRHFAEQAAYHCDKHVVKMIAESVQMLVTVMHPHTNEILERNTLGRYYSFNSCLEKNLPCKPLGKAHAKHPCVLWTGNNIEHTYYLLRLALALCGEKQRRWPLNPEHQYHAWLRKLHKDFDSIGFALNDPLPATFAVATKQGGLESIPGYGNPHIEVVTIYRDYYAKDKASFAKWKHPAQTPVWFMLAVEDVHRRQAMWQTGYSSKEQAA
jgi:hypothetical protein